jgi:transposase InsO family protein
MSAALTLTSAPPRVNLQTHATAEEAAHALGITSRQVRRLCADELLKKNLAACVALREQGDKKPRWYLSRSYDLRLGRGQVGQVFQLPDLSGYSERQETIAWQRAACVQALRDARQRWTGRQQDWLPTLCAKLGERYHDLKITERTLRRWHKVYRTPADLLKLIDTRGGNQKGQADPAAWDFFKLRFLDERQPTIKVCWEHTRDEARQNGWAWLSYKQCVRLLDRRIPPQMQAQYREPRRFRQSFAPYIEQDVDAWQANACWVGDHSPLDLWCRSGEHVFRPTITAWIDWRSRRLMGWLLSENPDGSTITAALRQAILDPAGKGPPEAVWIDNGKDFDCFSLHGQTKKQRLSRRQGQVNEERVGGILQHLGIEAHWSLAHNPNGKSVIERWFGTLHSRFDRDFATYCGKDSQHKPESLNGFLHKNPGQIPTLEHVTQRLGEFIAGYNARSESESKYLLIDGVHLSPDQAMARLCPHKRMLADPAALDMLMQSWHQPVRVGRNGVRITPKGSPMSFGQFEPSLAEFKGSDRKVNVAYDPDDLRSVRVFDDQWRFVCEARSNTVGNAANPLKQADLKEALAQKKRYTRAKREYAKGTHHEWLSTEEVAAMNLTKGLHDAQDTTRPPDSDPPMKIIQTPFDGQSSKATKPLRKAAGAEHDELARPRQSFFQKMVQQDRR